MSHKADDPITVERIERALDEVAIAIEMAGPKGHVYLPIYERLKQELIAQREKDNASASIRARPSRELKVALPPRFMTDAELRVYFGLSERALGSLKLAARFPQRDSLIGKTDSKAVDYYFDQRAGLPLSSSTITGIMAIDGKENWK